MAYIIFEICFSTLKKKSLIFTFSKQSFLGIFDFWLKHPKITRVAQKTVKVINLPYYLSHFIKKNTVFNIDLFSWTFDMESPYLSFQLVLWRKRTPG